MRRGFFDEQLLLNSETAQIIYKEIKNLPIIDYHCHLNEKDIYNNITLSDIGEAWLKEDHYKWRAMRLCGIDEHFITGKSTYEEKFMKFSEVVPKLLGNPLYYWAHMELNRIYKINLPLNPSTAKKIYLETKKVSFKIHQLLSDFNVEYVATTDDITSSLSYHGNINGVRVAPTFRPDRLFLFEDEYIEKLSTLTKTNILDLSDLKCAIEKRLLFFIEKGCKISDHGMDFLPTMDIGSDKANELFINRKFLNENEKYLLFSHLMYFLAELYKKHHIVMQLHFGTFRNVNKTMSQTTGKDSGFDIMRSTVETDKLVDFFNVLTTRDGLPKVIMYSLNDNAYKSLVTLSGAFDNVRLGASWWFNDTVNGIKKQLNVTAEYGVFGLNLGMLTDSRSFTSYVRFDFYRRILSSFIADFVNNGEYAIEDAITLAKNISYYNIKEFLNL